MEKLFEILDVTKIFGEKNIEVRALDGVTLDILKGEFMALVGPSGSGKSTLLNIMSGLDIPTAGSVKIVGKDISQMDGDSLSEFRRDYIGFIFQSYNLIPVLTVKENIEYVMLLQGKDEFERKKAVKRILEEVGLEGFEKRFPKELSGGQQQRVAIARAVVSRPQVILADEPTANLDSQTATALIDLMARLNKEYKMTFVFSTHDTKIMKRAKRLISLEDGKIVDDKVV